MEKIKSTVKLLRNWLEQWSPQIFMVFILVILMGSVGWFVQDSRAGHQELQSAAIVEKIYRRAVDDEILVPIDSNGTMMTIDTSTPARFIIKLALNDRVVVKVKVRKLQFESLDVGESVNFKSWIGRSGRIYRQSIVSKDRVRV
jgi:hypothetical protein